MIHKPIDEVIKTDIDTLVGNQVRESRTIEYKAALPGNSDDGKREFLADISSFANASGGDLLYGITAVDGVPNNAAGLGCTIDAEMQRLENILRDGVEPRIPYIRMKPIDGFPQGPVLFIRIPKSWTAPHMITFRNWSRLFTRNCSGKYQMDVVEIRSAVLLSEALPDKIRRFRDERIAKILASETPVPLRQGARLVLHLMPISLLASNTHIPFPKTSELCTRLNLVGAGGWNSRYNLDGFVNYTGRHAKDTSNEYCQLFRSGISETVYSLTLDERKFSGTRIENIISNSVNVLAGFLKHSEVSPPLLVFLTLTGMSDTIMRDVNWLMADEVEPVDRDVLILPDVSIETYENIATIEKTFQILRPIYDALWNACGFPRSLNYDDQGNWHPSRIRK